MKNLFFSTAILLLALLISLSFSHNSVTTADDSIAQNNRETLEIVIGFGGPAYPPDYENNCPDCSSPPEPQCPPPLPPTLPPSPPPPPPRPPKRSTQPPRPPTRPKTSPSPGVFSPFLAMLIQNFGRRITNDPRGIVKTWKGNNICKYKGFICAKTRNKNRIVGINFNQYKFDGKSLNISDLIYNLSDLVYLHVNTNKFTGSFPSNISKQAYLYEIDVSNNKFSGSFPMEVLTATNLTFLDLRYNQITGPVPPQVFNLDLDALFLNNNMFSGKLPENLFQTGAIYLTLANNNFTGHIPKNIGYSNITLLEVLFLNNYLSGCLPYEIGKLKNITLFDASKNQLTGTIPHSLGCLSKLQQFNLSYNQFYGPVPEIVCKLGKLYELSLQHNYFTQVGPECRKLIGRKLLDVSMNCILDLPQQRSADECAAFFSVHRPSCPDDHIIPCNIKVANSQEASDIRPRRAMAPSPTYAALENHN